MSKETAGFVTANMGGIALYTYLCWRISERIRYEQRTAEFADGLSFLVTAFLVLCIFVLANLIWVAVMANQHRKHGDSKAGALFGISAIAAWIAVYFTLPLVI